MPLDNQIERLALSGLLEAAKAFYQDESNKQAFEAWKKEKEIRHEDCCNF